ncbi:DMP19 family protein [Paenibacillus sp. SAF-068]|uniref:DMP19 family protein n=1 Tax=Paenibacillus sp. SAF-068 TaxID=3436864 RepID=UPI003F7D59B0
MSEQDNNDVWYDYAVLYVGKKNDSGQGWAALTSNEQEIAALWLLETDVFNGGFIQFFCNWGEEAYRYALRALQTIGATQVTDIITSAYGCIKHLEEDERLTELWDIPKLLSMEQEQQLDALDEQFWNNEDQIAEKAYGYYHGKLNMMPI